MMNTTENNQKVYIEGYNHGEIFEAGVHGIGPLQGTDEFRERCTSTIMVRTPNS